MADDAGQGQEPLDDGQEPLKAPGAGAGQEPVASKDASGETPQWVRDLRKSEAAARKKAADLEAKLKEHDDAKLSETERMTNRIAELEKAHTEAQKALISERTRNAVQAAATRAGAVDADAVYRLLDADDLELDSEGRPKNVDAAVKALLKERTWLARTPGNADGGAGSQQRNSDGGGDMNTLIRRMAGRTA